MTTPIRELDVLLRNLRPVLNPGVYVFAMVSSLRALGSIEPLATFREHEGLTVIVTESQAEAAGLALLFRAAWITLGVNSDLQAVGLTAAVASVLARAGVSCNVLAAVQHDHLFVPVERAAEAMALLQSVAQ